MRQRKGKFKGAFRAAMGPRVWITCRLRAVPVLCPRPKRKSDIEYRLGYLQAQSEWAYSGNKRPSRTFHADIVRHIPIHEVNLSIARTGE